MSLRLCLINSATGWGGAERLFEELAAGLRQARHDVDFVCRPGTAMLARVPRGATRHALPFRGDLDLITALRLLRLFRARRPHAILCNFGRECWLAGWAAAPLGLPVVHVKGVADQRLGARSRFLYRCLVARVVCVSQAVRDGFAGLGVPEERFVVIANGIDVRLPADSERAAARHRLGAGREDFLVVYCGRLNRDKGVDLLPAVVAALQGEGVPVRLAVVGDGEARADVQAGCIALGIEARVLLAGFVDDPLPFVAAADAAVIPSRWTEAFGLVALEALAVGTPVVATRTGGLSEILADEETGLLVGRDDVPALVRALARIYREPSLAGRLRANGKARAAQFSRRRMIERYEALLHEIAGGERRSG